MTGGRHEHQVKRVSGCVTLMLGLAVAAMLWADGRPPHTLISGDPLRLGGVVSLAIALLLAANARNRAIANVLRRALVALGDDARPVPEVARERSASSLPGAFRRATPAWLALAGGIAVSVVFGRDPAALSWLTDAPHLLIGMTAALIVWSLVVATVTNGGRVRRLVVTYRIASMEDEIGHLRGALTSARVGHEQEIAERERSIRAHRDECERLRRDLGAAAESAAQTDRDLTATRHEREQVRDELETLREQHRLLAAEERRLDAGNRRLEALSEKLRRRVDTAEAEAKTQRREIERRDERLVRAAGRLEAARGVEAELRANVSRLAERTHGLEAELDEVRAGQRDDAGPAAAQAPSPESPAAPERSSASARAAVAARTSASAREAASTPASPPALAAARVRVATSAPAASPDGGPPRPRLPQELLECNLGGVLELGCDGIRVSCAKAPEGRTLVVLPEGHGTLSVEAVVESSTRLGVRKHDVVLRFVDVAPATRQRILRVAMSNRGRAARPINSIATD